MIKKSAFLLLLGGIFVFASIDWKSDLIFSHKFHVQEVEADCQTCHAAADTSLMGKDDLLPQMETCYSCHDEDDTECTVCHKQPDEPVILPRVENYSAKFNHKTHIEKKTPCTTCHTGIELKETVTSSMHLPHMKTCMNCHAVPDTKEGCYTCHGKEEQLKPLDHNLVWSKNHGMAAESGSQQCRMCHTQSYCTDCHQGENLLSKSHPPNFIATHSLSYQIRESDCSACHEGKDFCIECHMNVNYTKPVNHSQADWATTGHREAALSDYDHCTVCHRPGDLVCSQCHN